MYRKLSDFLERYAYESENTAKMFAELTDKSLSQSVTDGHRTLGRIAWHIVTTIPEMMSQTGLGLTAVNKEAPVPETAAEILESYKQASAQLIDRVSTEWNDDRLLEEDELYGEKWAKGLTLDILIRHEVHHRGQMTVLMRQAGLKVPGVYGPAMEEWAAYGAPAPAI